MPSWERSRLPGVRAPWPASPMSSPSRTNAGACSTVECPRLRYTRVVTRSTRLSTAAVLALAVAAWPLVLDQCAASCVEHHEAAGIPSCHQATTTSTRIGAMPTSCGHDHTRTTVTSAKTSPPVERGTYSIVAVVALPAPFAQAFSDRRLLGHSPPGARRPLDARSLPLRI
jgi:hypothetical protein